MPFRFKITDICFFARAKITVMEGEVLSGSVTTEQPLYRVVKGEQLPLIFAGVLKSANGKDESRLSLSFKVPQRVLDTVKIGDELTAD